MGLLYYFDPIQEQSTNKKTDREVYFNRRRKQMPDKLRKKFGWILSIHLFHYIHQNPYAAKLVKKLEDWESSSFKDYIGLRNGTLCNQYLARELLNLPTDKNEFYEMSYDIITLDKLDNIF